MDPAERVVGAAALDVDQLLRRPMVTSPEPPSATVNSPSGLLTVPIGVITAAVPQANASRTRPDAAPSRHSSRLTGRSSTGGRPGRPA